MALREIIPTGEAIELFSSDLRRATQTADALAAVLDVHVTLLPGLRGISYGDADGKPQQRLDVRPSA